MEFEEEEQEVTATTRIPCQFCNRKFVPESYFRHVKVCEKTLCKKRKTFDSAQQRIKGTELAEYLPVMIPSRKNSLSNAPFKDNLEILKTTENVPFRKINYKNATSLISKSSNHEKCPYCDRSFGQKAYDRHIEWCKEQSIRINLKSTVVNQEAKERWEARTKYRAPSFRVKRNLGKEHSKDTSNCESTFVVDSNVKEHKTNDVNRTKAVFDVASKVKSLIDKPIPKGPHKETNFIRQNVLRCSFKNRLPRKNDTKLSNGFQNYANKSDCFELENYLSANGTKMKSLQSSNVMPLNNYDKLSTSMYEKYNPYLVAEYQMKQLFNDDNTPNNSDKNINQTFTLHNSNNQPLSISLKEDRRNKFNNKENISQDYDNFSLKAKPNTNDIVSDQDKNFYSSSTSAFSKYACNGSDKCNRAPTPMPSLDFDKNEDDYFLPPINKNSTKVNESLDLNMNRYPFISLSNLSLCSSVSIDLPDENRKSGMCKSADKPRDITDMSTNQRSMSALNTNEIKRTISKKNLKIEQMLYGIEEPKENTTFTKDDLFCKQDKLNSLLENDNFDLINSFTDFENMLQDAQCNATKSDSQPDTKFERGDSIVSKMSIDSAYNSLNRKSPALSETQNFYYKTSTPENDALKLSTYSLPADFRDQEKDQKVSKFCHECGAKYPLTIAKFCCECGVRRLII